MNDLESRTVGALGWASTGRIVRQGLQLVIMVVLARLLSPRPFGLVAMVAAVTGFASVLTDLGFGAALIQNQEVDADSFSSVMWLNVGAGFIVTVLFVAGAPILANFYNEPTLVAITSALAFNFIIQACQLVPRAILRRRLRFRPEAVVGVGAIVVSGATGIVMAGQGFGVWSLVAKSLIDSAVLAIGLWWRCSWKPQLRFSLQKIRELWNFSSRLLGSQIIWYWVRHIDDLLLGRFGGSSALGAYERAYRIMLFPLENLSNMLARVLFPSMSEIQDDKPRVKRVFLRASRSIALVTFPLMAGLAVLAEPFVMGIFGEDWSLMIPILRILAVLGLLQSVYTLVGNLFMSQGRTDIQFKLTLFLKPISILGIVAGLNWGAVGVAAGYTIAEFVTFFPEMKAAGRTVDMSLREVVTNLIPVSLTTLLMVAVLLLTKGAIPTTVGIYERLIIQSALGMVTFVVTAVAFQVDALYDTYAVVSRKIRE